MKKRIKISKNISAIDNIQNLKKKVITRLKPVKCQFVNILENVAGLSKYSLDQPVIDKFKFFLSDAKILCKRLIQT